MTKVAKELTDIELIKDFCCQVLACGIRKGLTTDGVKIWLSPQMAQLLKLNEILSIKVGERIYDVPIVIETTIKETSLGEGRFQSDIFIGNPDWCIDLAIGEGNDR